MIASLPQGRTEVKLGFDVQNLTPGLADKFKLEESRGVLISKVEPGSLAQSEGLHEGDLIKEVNRVDVGSVGEFSRQSPKLRRGETILLRVLRETAHSMWCSNRPTSMAGLFCLFGSSG